MRNPVEKISFFGKGTVASAVILMLVAGYLEGRISQGIAENKQEGYRKMVESQLEHINASLLQINTANTKLHDDFSARLTSIEHKLISWEDEIDYVEAYRNTGSWSHAERIIKEKYKK